MSKPRSNKLLYFGITVGLLGVGAVFAQQPAKGSFALRQTVAASKQELFDSEKEPETYWKYARKGYKPPVDVTRREDGMDYVLVDEVGGMVIQTPIKVSWKAEDPSEDYTLDFDWTLLRDVTVNTHWVYSSLSEKETDMSVVQTLEGPRWKVAFFTSSIAQKDFLHRMAGVANHFAEQAKKRLKSGFE